MQRNKRFFGYRCAQTVGVTLGSSDVAKQTFLLATVVHVVGIPLGGLVRQPMQQNKRFFWLPLYRRETVGVLLRALAVAADAAKQTVLLATVVQMVGVSLVSPNAAKQTVLLAMQLYKR